MSNNNAAVRDTVSLFQLAQEEQARNRLQGIVYPMSHEEAAEAKRDNTRDFMGNRKMPVPDKDFKTQMSLQTYWARDILGPDGTVRKTVSVENPLKPTGALGEKIVISIPISYNMTASICHAALHAVAEHYPQAKDAVNAWVKGSNTIKAVSVHMTSDMGRLAYAQDHYPLGDLYRMPAEDVAKLYPQYTFEEYEEVRGKNVVPLSDHMSTHDFIIRIDTNPEADSGISYRDPGRAGMAVRREHTASLSIERLEKRLGVLSDPGAYREWLKTTTARLWQCCMLKPKFEMYKRSNFEVKHRPICVFSADFQTLGQGILLRGWKRVKNVLEDPRSCTIYNMGWAHGSATLFAGMLAELPVGFKHMNAGDDALYVLKVWDVSEEEVPGVGVVRYVEALDGRRFVSSLEPPPGMLTLPHDPPELKTLIFLCAPDITHNDGSQQPLATARFLYDLSLFLLQGNTTIERHNEITARWKNASADLVSQWFNAPILVNGSLVVNTPYHSRTGHPCTTFYNNAFGARVNAVNMAWMQNELIGGIRPRPKLWLNNESFIPPPVTEKILDVAFEKVRAKQELVGVRFKPGTTQWKRWTPGTDVPVEILGFSLVLRTLKVRVSGEERDLKVYLPKYRDYPRLAASLVWDPRLGETTVGPKAHAGMRFAQALGIASLCPDVCDVEQNSLFEACKAYYETIRSSFPDAYSSVYSAPDEEAIGDSPINDYIRSQASLAGKLHKEGRLYKTPVFISREFVTDLYLPRGIRMVASSKPASRAPTPSQVPNPATTPIPTFNFYDLLEQDPVIMKAVVKPLPVRAVEHLPDALIVADAKTPVYPSIGAASSAAQKLSAFTDVALVNPFDFLVPPEPIRDITRSGQPGRSKGKDRRWENLKRKWSNQKEDREQRRREFDAIMKSDLERKERGGKAPLDIVEEVARDQEEVRKAEILEQQAEADAELDEMLSDVDSADLEEEEAEELAEMRRLRKVEREEAGPSRFGSMGRKRRGPGIPVPMITIMCLISMICLLPPTVASVVATPIARYSANMCNKTVQCLQKNIDCLMMEAAFSSHDQDWSPGTPVPGQFTPLTHPQVSTCRMIPGHLSQIPPRDDRVMMVIISRICRPLNLLFYRLMYLMTVLMAMGMVVFFSHLVLYLYQTHCPPPLNPSPQWMVVVGAVVVMFCLLGLFRALMIKAIPLLLLGSCGALSLLKENGAVRGAPEQTLLTRSQTRCCVFTITRPQAKLYPVCLMLRPLSLHLPFYIKGERRGASILVFLSESVYFKELLGVTRILPARREAPFNVYQRFTMPNKHKNKKPKRQKVKIQQQRATARPAGLRMPMTRRRRQLIRRGAASRTPDAYRAWIHHVLFPEAVAAAPIPDGSGLDTTMIVTETEVSVPINNDSKSTGAAAYAGLVVYDSAGCSTPTASMATSTDDGTSVGSLNWSTTVNSQGASSIVSDMTMVRQVAAVVEILDVAALSNLQGSWSIAQLNGVGNTATVNVAPANYNTFASLRVQTVAANDVDNAGIRRALMPCDLNAKAFNNPDTAAYGTCGLVFVWKGAQSSNNAFRVRVTQSWECVPTQTAAFKYNTTKNWGNVGKCCEVLNQSLPYFLEMGSTKAAAARVFDRVRPEVVGKRGSILSIGGPGPDAFTKAKCYIDEITNLRLSPDCVRSLVRTMLSSVDELSSPPVSVFGDEKKSRDSSLKRR